MGFVPPKVAITNIPKKARMAKVNMPKNKTFKTYMALSLIFRGRENQRPSTDLAPRLMARLGVQLNDLVRDFPICYQPIA